MDNTRSSAKYKAWVKQVMAKCEPTCIRCGYPVDMALPRTDDWGASADHEPPLAETGEIAPSLDASGIAHLKCNRSHGGRLGSQRATNKRAKPQPRFSRHTTSTPAAPVLYPPEGAGRGGGMGREGEGAQEELPAKEARRGGRGGLGPRTSSEQGRPGPSRGG